MTTLNVTTLAQVQLSQVIEQLKQDDTKALINIYNQYADAMSYERVYDNDEDTINDLYDSAWTAISMTNHDGYRDSHDYFTYNGYGLMSSFEYISDDNSPIDIEELSQWIVDNELYNEYSIEVTTLDDMLASIEDNITDDESLTYKLANYINESYDSDDSVNDVAQWCIVTLYDYDYDQLNDIITMLGINYE